MDMELAQIGLEAYVEALPSSLTWKDCTATTRKAWAAAAKAIERQVLEERGLKEI